MSVSSAGKLVLIESPYAGDVEINVVYAKRCMLDSFKRGETPFLSHLLYTQVLNDLIPAERMVGIEAGFAWGRHAELVAVYVDRDVSPGMEKGIARALKNNQSVEFRSLDGADLTAYPDLRRVVKPRSQRIAEMATAMSKGGYSHRYIADVSLLAVHSDRIFDLMALWTVGHDRVSIDMQLSAAVRDAFSGGIR